MAASLSFQRSCSPIPPPLPSPQLLTTPLPSPPPFYRHSARGSSRDRPSSSRSYQEQSFEQFTEASVIALRKAILATARSRQSCPSLKEPAKHQPIDIIPVTRSRSTRVPRASTSSDESFISETDYNHRSLRRSSGPPSASRSFPPSRSFSRSRLGIRSAGGIVTPLSDPPPPVPPLPPNVHKHPLSGNIRRRPPPPPISIPDRTSMAPSVTKSPRPSSSSHSSRSSAESGRRTKEFEEESFLIMSKRERRPSKPNLVWDDTLPGCLPMRPSQSLPDIKHAKRRSTSSSFAGRIFRLGTNNH